MRLSEAARLCLEILARQAYAPSPRERANWKFPNKFVEEESHGTYHREAASEL